MKNITFKIAPKGEGKTRWLLNIAKQYASERSVLLVVKDNNEYSKFCDKYLALFNEVCPVKLYNTEEVDETSVVLIDNYFEHILPSNTIEYIRRKCYKMFITLEGKTEDSFAEESTNYEQISIFDYLKEENNEG